MMSTMLGSKPPAAAGTGICTLVKPLVIVLSATFVAMLSTAPVAAPSTGMDDRKKTLMSPPIAPGAYARMVSVCPLRLYGTSGAVRF